MIAKNVSELGLNQALWRVNEKYDSNIRFRYLKQISVGRYQFTLTVKDSRQPGARRSHSGRRLASACWHVHRDFFDALCDLQPNAVITAGKKKITKDAGNWEDWNIGSMMQPMYYSEACECN